MPPRKTPRTKQKDPVSRQSPLEELLNGLLHGVGLLLFVAGTVVLVVTASRWGTARHIVGVAVFGAALIGLYGISTLYHSVRNPAWKRALRSVDHMAIYLLIAGSYAPFALGPLYGPWGWSLLGVIYGLAVAGVLFKLRFGARFPWASTLFYLAMGWMVVIAIVPLARVLPGSGMALLVSGGVAYSVGAVFYMWDERVKFFHSVFHAFVLVGSICHYWAVFDYLNGLS